MEMIQANEYQKRLKVRRGGLQRDGKGGMCRMLKVQVSNLAQSRLCVCEASVFC